MVAASATVTGMMCGIVPPLLLQRLARSADPELREHARRTLDLDAIHRTDRAGPAPRRAEPQQPDRTIADAQNARSLPGTVVRGEGEPPTDDPAVDETYRWLGDAYRLYRDVFGRDSIDGAGLPLLATVHYGESYDNAFWNGDRMVYGDGDGRVFGRFTRPITITAHELTHGVIQHSAALDYSDQSGALNESVADVFASLVKQHANGEPAAEADWLIGEGLFQPDIDGVALRSLAEPGSAYDDPLIGSDPQPSTMADYVETTEDNGGVHINSGIPNHAFYHTATALGGYAWERAGQIWYDTLTGDLASDADFATFARRTVEAAGRRYGGSSAEADAVRQGWSEVGIEP